MRRKGNIISSIASPANVILSDKRARKGKVRSRKHIAIHDRNIINEDMALSQSMSRGTFHTSPYTVYRIYEPKEREICRLPYYPDRIAQHAIMRQLKGYWTSLFIRNSYSCIENHGIHLLQSDLEKVLRRYPEETTYCLKIDIRKFYPTIDHQILKGIISHKIKDNKLLALLYDVIDSISTPPDKLPEELLNKLSQYSTTGNQHLEKGVPIGNYLSQFFANLYLTPFDVWCKQELKCRHYFRYADDIVILSSDKQWLRNRLLAIKLYLWHELRLVLKPNYQIFPVDSRGIDYVGYVFYHTHTKVRKSIKNRCRRKLGRNFNKAYPSYYGWLCHADCKHLARKLLLDHFHQEDA